MTFEELPDTENPELVPKNEQREHIENKGYEDAVHASFVLTAAALGLIGAEGCDINKAMEPENLTKIISVSSEVKKKFKEGFITFSACRPEIFDEDKKTIEMQVSTLIVEDAEHVDEKGFKKYYGARFIKTGFTDSDTTSISVRFFGDDQRVYDEPCNARIIPKTEDLDRYHFLIENLNIRLNALQAIKHIPGAVEEEQAVRTHIKEFVGLLDTEFPNAYDAAIVQEILL